MKRAVAVVAAILLLAAQRAGATVYSWRGADGALHFSNDADEVPAEHAAAASRFTARAPSRPTAPAVVAPDGRAGTGEGDLEGARAFAAGVRAGREQLLEAAELARLWAGSREVPIAPLPVERPPGVSVSIVRAPGFPWSDQGCCGTSWPVWYPFLYGPAFLGRSFGRPLGRPFFGRPGHASRGAFFGRAGHGSRGAGFGGGRGAKPVGFRFPAGDWR